MNWNPEQKFTFSLTPSHFLALPLMVVAMLIGVVGGVALDRTVLGASIPPQPAVSADAPDFRLIKQAWTLIDQNYVDRSAVTSQHLTYGAISGMVTALGDTGHSTFLTPEMQQAQKTVVEGSFEGIGAEVEMRNGYMVIVSPLDGSPAEQAGLKPGDIIVKVDGKDMTGETFDSVLAKVRGPAGTTVTLTVADPQTGNLRDVTITRAKIQIHSVSWQMLPGTTIAHVRISQFSKGMTADLITALKNAKAQGATAIILDLRNNPGGLLDEAISGASQFLATGNVLLTQNAKGKQTPVPVEQGGAATDLPMVVLVNQGTASAAEIAAGALQDAGRAKLIGETTFGTGTVLNQFDLPDGSALLLATEQWLTPKGRVIWHQGIVPDEQVKLGNNVQMLIPAGEKDLTAQQLSATDDIQLETAIKMLEGTNSSQAGR